MNKGAVGPRAQSEELVCFWKFRPVYLADCRYQLAHAGREVQHVQFVFVVRLKDTCIIEY